MTDESFPFMRWRMLTLICCHVSPWLKGVFVRELVWDKQEGGRDVKRVGVSVKRRFSLHFFYFFFFYFQLSNDSLKAPKSSLVHTLQHDRWCVFITKSIEWMSTPEPTVHSFPERNATHTEYWNKYETLPSAVIFRINYEEVWFQFASIFVFSECNIFCINTKICCL